MVLLAVRKFSAYDDAMLNHTGAEQASLWRYVQEIPNDAPVTIRLGPAHPPADEQFLSAREGKDGMRGIVWAFYPSDPAVGQIVGIYYVFHDGMDLSQPDAIGAYLRSEVLTDDDLAAELGCEIYT